MAFVGISERLRDDVRNTIRRKQNQELALLPKAALQMVLPDDPRLIKKFWGEYEHLRDLMPEAWCGKVDSVQFVAPYEQEPGNPASVTNVFVSVGILGGNTKVPPKTDTYHPRIQVEPDAPEVVETISVMQQQYAVNKRWNKVAEDVMTFLTNCKSLNEALKLWPDIRIYIPQSFLDKAEEKTQKAKAAESRAMEILKQIDTDHAVSSAVLVRMLEASKQQEVQP